MDAAFVKRDVTVQEALLQSEAFDMLPNNVPRVLNYQLEGPNVGTLTMRAIQGDNLANLFGDDGADMTNALWYQVRRLLRVLYEGGVILPDITGYNFMLDNGKVWVFDFGHAVRRVPGLIRDADVETDNWFVRNFVLAGPNGFNTDFA